MKLEQAAKEYASRPALYSEITIHERIKSAFIAGVNWDKAEVVKMIEEQSNNAYEKHDPRDRISSACYESVKEALIELLNKLKEEQE